VQEILRLWLNEFAVSVRPEVMTFRCREALTDLPAKQETTRKGWFLKIGRDGQIGSTPLHPSGFQNPPPDFD
jgi:hypothetical protein